MLAPRSTTSRRLRRALRGRSRIASPLIAAAALLAAAGCTTSDAQLGYDRKGWENASLEEITQVAEQVRTGPLGCEGFAPEDWNAYRDTYRRLKLPMPAAQGNCEGSGEDLTFYGFADEDAKQRWVKAKGKSLCARGYAIDWRFTLPYVDGGTWIIEPDSDEAAKRLAESLGRDRADMCEVAGIERPPPPDRGDTPSTDGTTTTAPTTAT